jgi:hypothetical protein
LRFAKPVIHIGIDLDHTIIDYRNVFAERAMSLGFIDSKVKLTKDEVKKIIKKSDNGERKWSFLQSDVYSEGICDAVIMEDFSAFVKACREYKIQLSVISHKTKNNPFDPLERDLQKAALSWMEHNHFFNKEELRFSRKQINFAETVEDKVARIEQLKCSHFIDDLFKVLSHPRFPKSTRKSLYHKSPQKINDVTVDSAGNIYTAEPWENSRIQIFPPNYGQAPSSDTTFPAETPAIIFGSKQYNLDSSQYQLAHEFTGNTPKIWIGFNDWVPTTGSNTNIVAVFPNAQPNLPLHCGGIGSFTQGQNGCLNIPYTLIGPGGTETGVLNSLNTTDHYDMVLSFTPTVAGHYVFQTELIRPCRNDQLCLSC